MQDVNNRMPPSPELSDAAVPAAVISKDSPEKEVTGVRLKTTVVAARAGYRSKYCQRIPEGQEFQLDEDEVFGSWMKLADPEAEKKRQVILAKEESLRKITEKKNRAGK